jgi:D-lactate dehydrogenase
MQIFDAVEYVHDTLLKRLKITNRLRTVALHPVCSLVKLGLQPKFEHIARACSENVLLPQSSECCGFAGDRGFLFPELTASATRAEAAELKGVACEGFYSSSRTCEIAMTRATGEVYRSYLHLVHRATDPELVTDDVRHFPGDAKNADTGSKSGFEMDVQRQKT